LSLVIERASDVWALGRNLVRTGQWSPSFARPDAEDFQAIRAIQFSNRLISAKSIPDSNELKERHRDLSEKNPGARY